jgi:hypothetical protein
MVDTTPLIADIGGSELQGNMVLITDTSDFAHADDLVSTKTARLASKPHCRTYRGSVAPRGGLACGPINMKMMTVHVLSMGR